MPTHINGRPVKTGSWLQEEDDLLAEWQAKLGNRSATSCCSGIGQWYSPSKTFTHGSPAVLRAQAWAVADHCHGSPPEQPEQWLLLLLLRRWSAVAKKIPGRTGQQCAQRWRHKVRPACGSVRAPPKASLPVQALGPARRCLACPS